MTARNTPRAAAKHNGFGLVANGSAGAWRVDIDETLSGAQRWFAQIEGPACYLYFEIDHPLAVVKMARFLGENVHQENGSHDQKRELKLGNSSGHTVEFLWDREPGDRCFILLRGDNEFCVRVTLLHDDLEALVSALEQVRESLREEGLVAQS